MSKNEPAGTKGGTVGTASRWWCNFCEFRTEDQREYLAHSCGEYLTQQGKSPDKSDKNAAS